MLVEVPCEVNMCKICYNKKIDFVFVMGNISLFHEPLSVSVTKGTNFDVTLYVVRVCATYKYHSVGQNKTKIFLARNYENLILHHTIF